MTVSPKNSANLSTWWKAFYDDCPFDLLLESEGRELKDTIDFLQRELHLQPGAKVFDQCCGTGTLSFPLAERGMNVVGADLCQKFIDAANLKAESSKAPCSFTQADAYEFTSSDCDGAFNWWTSFGYAGEDSQNIKMIARAYASLKPGGWFALDFPNMAHTIYTFDKYKERTTSFVKDGQTIELHRASELDLNGGYLKQTWRYIFADGTAIERNSSVRLYLPYTLVNFFKDCGFQSVTTYANVQSRPLSLANDRVICVGQKPL
ncbi:MAG: methyltransferase domain-containing protein [Cyanobacteria bacterium REEB67]|nr:methyltransferase domain-containing protein [Cyanobacteria bacterium REEB67]